MPKISKRVVDAAGRPTNADRTFVWDSEVKGFGLMVTARGAKSYVVQYRTPEGRSRRITIGRRGSPWDGLSERVGPNQVACGRVQGIDIVAFGRDQQPADIRPRRAPKEELRIDVPGDSSLERLIKVQGSRAFSDQAGHREIATATSTAMIGQDVVLSLFLGLALGSGFGGRGNHRRLGDRERTRARIGPKCGDCDQESRCRLYRVSNSAAQSPLHKTRN
jgi:hypothetical protein